LACWGAITNEVYCLFHIGDGILEVRYVFKAPESTLLAVAKVQETPQLLWAAIRRELNCLVIIRNRILEIKNAADELSECEVSNNVLHSSSLIMGLLL
jgi:hypothetical protein